MTRAYLVVYLGEWPCGIAVHHVGVYPVEHPESPPALKVYDKHPRAFATITSAEGPDYASARARVYEITRTLYPWLVPFLDREEDHDPTS